MKFYPPGPVTRRGAQLLLERVEPLVVYESGDKSIQWGLNGGLDPTPGVEEGAFLTDGVQGLHPSFNFVEHKGARQHGVTVQHTVFEPAEYDMQVEFTVPPNHVNPRVAASAIRRVIREWLASWDPTNPGTLMWVTPDMGRWYCHPRLFRSPPDRQFRAQARRLRQKYTWTIRNDDAFWKGVDSVSSFRFRFELAADYFDRDDVGNLGPQWQQTYTGVGAGICETDGRRARWYPSGTNTRTVVNRLKGVNEIQIISIVGSFTGGTWTYTVNGQTTAGIAYSASAATFQTAIEALSNVAPGDVVVIGSPGGPYKVIFSGALAFQNVVTSVNGIGLTPGGTAASAAVATPVQGNNGLTATDNQLVVVKIGDPHQWPPSDQSLDIWARLNTNDASPTGIRCRLNVNTIILSRFNAGVETVMYTSYLGLLIPPIWGEEFGFVCGTNVSNRNFVLLRNGHPIMNFTETGTGSVIGSSNRGTGWGMRAGAGTTQDVPASIDWWYMGDNVNGITQSGHVTLTNFGDQDGSPRYLVYGPGTFKIANGPGSSNFIEFGPLADKQIALLTTIPRLRGVVDLSPDQPAQQLDEFQKFVKSLLDLAVNSNTPPLLEWFESLLGIRPPQGELYSLLRGRFTKAIPKKPAGEPPVTSSIAVQIVNGNADSKIVAALTPLRRWPE